MKRIIVFLLFLSWMGINCQSSHEEGYSRKSSTAMKSPISMNQWKRIARLQHKIQKYPDNKELISQYLKLSTDPHRKLLFSVGYSMVSLSNLNGSLQFKSGEQAAFFIAQEWASYIHQWMNTQPSTWQFGQLNKIRKPHVYYREVQISQDTLFIYVAFEMVH